MTLTLLRTEPESLLSNATCKQHAGDFLGAVSLLRKAYDEIVARGMVFEAEVFTRLPLLLQQAKHSKEGWREIHKLMIDGCPGRGRDSEKATLLLDRSIICDKARLFLQREKQYDRAVLYGLQFYLYRWMACYEQQDLGQIGPMRSQKAIRGILKPLLKKANKAALEDELVVEISRVLHKAPNINHRAFLARVATMLAVYAQVNESVQHKTRLQP